MANPKPSFDRRPNPAAAQSVTTRRRRGGFPLIYMFIFTNIAGNFLACLYRGGGPNGGDCSAFGFATAVGLLLLLFFWSIHRLGERVRGGRAHLAARAVSLCIVVWVPWWLMAPPAMLRFVAPVWVAVAAAGLYVLFTS